MWGVVLIVILLIAFYLYWVGKLNLNSINESSPSLAQSSDSLQVDPETNQLNVKLNSGRVSNVRIAHGDNKLSQVYIAEKPLSLDDIVKEGSNKVGTNSVFLGTVYDYGVKSPNAPSTSSNVTMTRNTANFDIREFKSMFVVFKGMTPAKTVEDSGMLRFELDTLTVCLIDPNASPLSEREVRELRKSNCTLVYTRNAAAQQILLENNFTVINAEQTAYLKNYKSYREMN
ncbi:odv-e25 protein [Thysanoplusia orichalcea nucleopolyhedrovirus]|uniref:Odv-e25 protein n=1 Tax=Thysanoplusia orichalcea nucleopolyhedrovirus TaxID=101850 RepID=L0CLD1_9ABAC|nr:odv-e25 protein [Thysanoplusia orichalcea nucleopolyhedrovirus]AGA16245.1 odv-e25 protein [Thysanoplusia orichalcea nucleopolyhedrovirus]